MALGHLGHWRNGLVHAWVFLGFERLYRIFHGDHSGQWLIASSAHAVDFSAWQVVHGFGILN